MRTFCLVILALSLAACASRTPAPVSDAGRNARSQPIQAASITPATRGGSSIAALLNQHVDSWKGTRYRYGGNSRRGIDCSAFIRLTYRELFATNLPRSTRGQSKVGRPVSRHRIVPGDLVFFRTGFRGRHVGIYTGDGRFAHVSRSTGVTESSLNTPYWRKRYWKTKRVMPN